MTAENKVFFKLLLSIAPPLILQELINGSVNILDTIMIGRSLGITEIAAAGLANQIMFMFFLTIFGVLSGSMVFSGQYFGKGDVNSIHKIIGIGLICNIVIACIFFISAQLIPELIIGIFSDDPVAIALASNYIRISSFTVFPIIITITRNMAMRSMRQTVVPMVTTCIALVCNFIFNYIALYVLGLGIMAVATTTVMVRTIEVILQEIIIRKYKLPIVAPLKKYFEFDRKFLAAFFKIASFIMIQEMLWGLGTSGYLIAYGRAGTYAIGSVNISMAIMHFFQIFGTSIGICTGIIISNTLGKGENELAKRYAKKCLITGMIASGAMGILLFFNREIIISFYNIEPHVEHYVYRLLLIVAFSMPIRTANFQTIVGILRSGGDAKFCLFLETASVWFVGLPLGLIVAYLGMPIYIIFFAVHFEEYFKFVIGTIRVFKNKWANTLV